MEKPVSIDEPPSLMTRLSELIPLALPHRFGNMRALRCYFQQAAQLPTSLASSQTATVGFLGVKQHGAAAAEIYTLAVRPEHHRQGIGRALVERAEAWCRDQGVEYLQVKTVGPSRPRAPTPGCVPLWQPCGFAASSNSTRSGTGATRASPW